MPATLNLIVLRTNDLPAAVAFYDALGLGFVEEQHGTGPRHVSAATAGIVLEIYPASGSRPAETSTRLGFAVTDVAATAARLETLGAKVVAAPANSAWGLRAVVADPDGRHVELTPAR